MALNKTLNKTKHNKNIKMLFSKLLAKLKMLLSVWVWYFAWLRSERLCNWSKLIASMLKTLRIVSLFIGNEFGTGRPCWKVDKFNW